MFLIIEGLHDSGKSTLVDYVCTHVSSRFKLYEGKRLFPELRDAKFASVSDFSLGSNCAIVWFAQYLAQFNAYSQHIIFDRLHFSEYAYSIVKRNTDKDKAMEIFKMVDDNLAKLDVRLINLHCDYESMMSRAKKKNVVYDKDDFLRLTNSFSDACNASKIKMITIDTGKCDCQEVASIATSFITRGSIL